MNEKIESPAGVQQPKTELEKAAECLHSLFLKIFKHNGFGSLDVSMRFLKRGQKEILIRCGREYRFVSDYPAAPTAGLNKKHKQKKEVDGKQ